MASAASVSLEERYRRVSLPLLAFSPRVPALGTWVRGSATAFTDDPQERFAVGVFLYVEGDLVWGDDLQQLAYGDPAEFRVPEAALPSEPGVLFVYATKQAYLDGEPVPRKRFEETWVFLASEGSGELAASIPAVPYIGSRKQVMDNHYHCFPGIRVEPGAWRSVAYVINPYPDPIDLRCWVQAAHGEMVELSGPGTVPPRSVRTVHLDAPERFDYGTLIVWGNFKPQGYVAIQDAAGRTRALDHFHPFWKT